MNALSIKIVIIGLSHKTAPVAIRERLAFSHEELPECLLHLHGIQGVTEVAVLSTCNRVELYCVVQNADVTIPQICTWLADNRHLPMAKLEPHFYIRTFQDAVLHGFRVASSLDSLVVGEAQILGQMKQTYQLASDAHVLGPILNKYFQYAFNVAKQVRNETGIARNPVSIASAAVALARKIFGALQGCCCLLIGAGEMCELAARHLVSDGVKILVANRTLLRAQNLAATFDGEAIPFEHLEQELSRADIIISSTGATTYLVTASMVKAALKRRRQRPQFLIDIAVPRDLDPDIAGVDNAYLYDIDDLNRIAENNLKDRGQEVAAAEVIIAKKTLEYMRWLESLEVLPVLTALREKLEGIRDQEVAKTLSNWPNLSLEDQKRVELLGHQLVNKILHSPLSCLRRLATESDSDLYVDAARQLFQLDQS